MPYAQEEQRRNAETVTMLAYSAMKNDANFMLAYSTWKPHQFVFRFRQIE
jgi:hypothetical protein